jgi:hypothetical protein
VLATPRLGGRREGRTSRRRALEPPRLPTGTERSAVGATRPVAEKYGLPHQNSRSRCSAFPSLRTSFAR